MGASVIRGRTMFTLADLLRARWNAFAKWAVVALAIVIFAMNVWDFAPVRNDTELVIAVVSLVSTVLIFVGGYIVLMMALFTLLALRGSKSQRDVQFEFGPTGLSMQDGTGAIVTTPWSVMQRAVETRTAIRLNARPAGYRYVPKRAFSSDDLSALRVLLVEKLGRKARLRAS